MNIIQTIRDEIRKGPLKPAEISRRTGVSTTALHRVLVQNGTLTSKSCDKLLNFFGYELVKKGGPASGGKKTKKTR